MKIIIASLLAVTLGGCSMIPSFWDDNESRLAVEVRYRIHLLDCSTEYTQQSNDIVDAIQLLEFYSESKGSNDLYDMIQPMQETAKGLQKMTVNETFCKLKKTQLEKQSASVADAVMWRY